MYMILEKSNLLQGVGASGSMKNNMKIYWSTLSLRNGLDIFVMAHKMSLDHGWFMHIYILCM